MPTTPFQPCTENPSYFSEKCRQCRFTCLADAPVQTRKEPDRSSNRGRISLLGSGAVVIGAVASLADYSAAAPALTVVGAVLVLAHLVRE